LPGGSIELEICTQPSGIRIRNPSVALSYSLESLKTGATGPELHPMVVHAITRIDQMETWGMSSILGAAEEVEETRRD